jgi:hypothetical protein
MAFEDGAAEGLEAPLQLRVRRRRRSRLPGTERGPELQALSRRAEDVQHVQHGPGE